MLDIGSLKKKQSADDQGIAKKSGLGLFNNADLSEIKESEDDDSFSMSSNSKMDSVMHT